LFGLEKLTREISTHKRLDFMEVLTSFNQCILKENEGPLPWLLELEMLKSQLKLLKVVKSENDMLVHIMGNVPKVYETTIDNAMAAFNAGTLTVAGLRAMLVEKHRRLLIKPKQEETAMFVGEGRKKRCEICGKTHATKKCFVLEINASKRPKDWKSGLKNSEENGRGKKRSGKGPKCFSCNKYGHIAKDCPKQKEEVAQTCEECLLMAKESNYFAEKNFWLADSGASCHMVQSMEGLFDT
jgi:Zinc knuckle